MAVCCRGLPRWINQYEALGIPVWGVTAQNEPGANILTYEGMVFTPASEAAFIRCVCLARRGRVCMSSGGAIKKSSRQMRVFALLS